MSESSAEYPEPLHDEQVVFRLEPLVSIARDDLPGKWVREAACRFADADDFTAEQQGKGVLAIELYDAAVTRAKAICSGCIVMERCATWALENGEEIGVWGGLSAEQRSRTAGQRKTNRRYKHFR